MKDKIWTQAEIDAVKPDKSGWRHFPANTKFSESCHFGNQCNIGEGCNIGNQCNIGEGCNIGRWSNIGDQCNIGNHCSIGMWSNIGNQCSIGEGGSIGERCSFGERCKLENNKELIGPTIFCANGFGSKNRTTYGIPTKKGVFVRCGRWSGWLDEFKATVTNTHGVGTQIESEYHTLAKLFEIRYSRTLKEVEE